jgi:hypothetical protein
MIIRIILLLLISASAYSQTSTELYVRLALPSTVVYCGYQPTTLQLTKKRVFFSCPEIEVDLKVTKRRKAVWTAVDKDNNVYKIQTGYVGMEFAIVILPKLDSGLKAIQFSKADLCK